MTSRYHVKRSKITGRSTVHFSCATCEAALHAPLEDAGHSERCPQCNAPFTVPGQKERDAETAAQHAEEAAVAARKAAASKAERELMAANRASHARKHAEEHRKSEVLSGSATRNHGGFGIALMLLGVILLAFGFFVDTTVGTSGAFGTDRVHNIGLIGRQLALVSTGTALLVSGTLLRISGAIGDEMCRWGDSILKRLEQDAYERGRQHTHEE